MKLFRGRGKWLYCGIILYVMIYNVLKIQLFINQLPFAIPCKMTQTLHHGKSTEKNISFVCETKLFVILSYIQIHSILCRIIFLFCKLNTPITLFVTILYKCQLPLVIPLLWFGQSMQWGYIPFLGGFMSPEKPTTRVKQFLRQRLIG